MSGPPVKNVVVLGSTGSVGSQALDVVRGSPDRYRVVGLASNTRWELLAEQVREFGPSAAVICDPHFADKLSAALEGVPVDLMDGPEGLRELAGAAEADIVVSAVSGAAGLPAAVEALEKGKPLALANKESLVMGGPLVTDLARRRGARLLPVDSEHSAVFQLLAGIERDELRKIVLTASGGPFREWSADRLETVTPEQALNHPTWDMGKKITIDSATLFNKALEVIEARWLFDLPAEDIEVVIHPQSVVHGMLELADGAVLAHLGEPDMRMPIEYALSYPERPDGDWGRLDLGHMGTLEFLPPDTDRFPALRLGYRVAQSGGTSGAVLNAANEVAVSGFLNGRLPFTGIAGVVESLLDRHQVVQEPDLEQILAADRWARQEAECILQSY